METGEIVMSVVIGVVLGVVELAGASQSGVPLWVYQALFGLLAIIIFFGLLVFVVRSMVAWKRRQDG